jgi:hypothetical protein
MGRVMWWARPLPSALRPVSHATFLALCLVLIQNARDTRASCPNNCNGKGTCGPGDKCFCMGGWTNGDCSGKKCPFGRSWFDKAYVNGTGHYNAECSGRGICNYDVGTCACEPGFTGDACDATECSMGCSGHGECVNMAEVAKENGLSYNNWEKKQSFLCRCDFGYSGGDCSQKLCPKGDDPETTGQNYSSYQLNVTSTSGHLGGTVRLFFQGFETTFNAHGSLESSDSCKTFLLKLNNLDTVTCTQGTVDSSTGGVVYSFTITSFPVRPEHNNLYFHDGAPPASAFFCDTSRAKSASGSVTCAVTVDTSWGTNHFEYLPCSRRGECDYTTGICKCATGYEGVACSTISRIVHYPCIDSDIHVHSTCPTFVGSALEVKSTRAANAAFTFFKGLANDELLFDIKGSGLFTTYKSGLIVRSGGETIVAGGMRVKDVGTTIDNVGMHVTNGGATIKSSGTTSPVVVNCAASENSFAGSCMVLKNSRVANTESNLMTAKVGDTTTVFSIRGDGLTRVHAGGMLVPVVGGTVTSGGLKVRDGATVHTSGLHIISGGATITDGGLTIADGGATIIETGLTATTVTSHASHATYTGTLGVLNVKSTRSGSSAFKLLEGKSNDDVSVFSVSGLGKTTVKGGLIVNTIGTTVTTAGLQTYAGTTVTTGGLQIPVAGVTTTAGGLNVYSGGSSISTAGASLEPLVIHSTSTSMTGSVLSVQSLKTSSLNQAYFYEMIANSATMLTIDHAGDLVASSTTDSTSSTTGSIRASGGLGVAAGIYVGGVMKVEATDESVSHTTGSVTIAGGVGVAKDVYVGGALVISSGTSVQPHSITGDTAVKTHSASSAADTATITLQKARGSEAAPTAVHSGDYLGEWNFRGYDGSSFVTGSTIRAINENAGAPVSSNQAGGKVVLATTSSNVGTTTDSAEIDMNGRLKVTKTTQSTSPSTGAFQSLGGVAIAKSLYVGEKLVSVVDDDQSVAITKSLVLTHSVGSNAAASGMGTSLTAYLENSNREVVKSGALEFKMSTATAGSEVSLFNMQPITAGTVAPALTGTGIDAASIVSVTPTTVSTSVTTGSFTVAGGMGIAKSIYSQGQLNANMDHSSTNTVIDNVVLEHTRTSGGPAQHMGVGIVVGLESADGNMQSAGSMDFSVSSAALGQSTRSGDFTLKTVQSNSLFDALKISRARTQLGSTIQTTSPTTGGLRVGGGMGIGKQFYSGGQIYSILDDSNREGVTDVVSLSHAVSNTAQNNIGVGIEIDLETDTAIVKAGLIESILTNATSGSEVAKLDISVLSGGSLANAFTLTGTSLTYADALQVVGNTALNGHAEFGNSQGDSGDSIYVNAVLQGTSAITFEGGVADAYELTLGTVDPTGTHSLLLPDVSGNIITTGNLNDITDTGTLESLTVSGTVTANGNTILGSDTADQVTVSGTISGTSPLVFNPDTSNAHLMTLALDDPSQDRTITLPDASGSIISTGNLAQIVSANTVISLTVTGQTTLTGTSTTVGSDAADTVTLHGSVSTGSITSANMVFEGATANNFETKLVVPASVSGEQTLTLPNCDGTIVTNGNLGIITELLSMTGLNVSGTTSFTQTSSLGDASGDTVTIDQRLLGATPIVFEGDTSSVLTTTLAIDTLSGDVTVEIPDASGTVITTGNRQQITSTGTLTSLTVTGAFSTQAGTTLGDSDTDSITFNGAIQGTTAPLVFQLGSFVNNVGLVGPSSAREITLPDAGGTIITTANMGTLITDTSTLTSLTVDGTATLNGAVTFGSSSTVATLTAPLIPHSSNNYITFEGSSGASQTTTLAAVDPSSTAYTVTLPDTGGVVITTGNLNDLTDLPSMTSLTVSGASNFGSTLTLGNAEADSIMVKSRILKGTAFMFKRAAGDTYTMSLDVEAPSSGTACKLVMPAVTGTILTTGNPTAAESIGTLSGGLTVSGVTALNGNVVVGDAATDMLTQSGRITGSLIFEGATADAHETTLNLVDPTGVNTLTIPADASGNVITTGNLGEIVNMGALSSMTLSGNAVFNGDVSIGTSVTFTGTIQGATPIRFAIPGSANLFKISVVKPTQDNSITIPNVDGTVITTASLTLITETGTLGSLTVTNGLTVSSGFNPVISSKGSATVSGSSVTLNNPAGSITTPTLTTGSGACTALTLTNSVLTASSTIMITVRSYTGYGTGTWDGTKGLPYVYVDTTGTATTRTINVCNTHSSVALNGALVIDFVLVSI